MESNPNHRAVTPVNPAAPYLGGKRNLAKRIIERIEAIPHTAYAEPFVGMGGVFLRRRHAPNCEVINDFSRDDFTALAAQLANIKGKFLLSINDVPEIRDIFAAFCIEAVETTYSIAKTSAKKVGELIISGR